MFGTKSPLERRAATIEVVVAGQSGPNSLFYDPVEVRIKEIVQSANFAMDSTFVATG